MIKLKHLNTALVALSLLFGAGHPAVAQEAAWPSRPINLVTPLAAGSPTDALARMVADELAQKLGQPIVIHNKPGGGTLIATQSVQNAKPDGYTFLFAVSAHTINPAIRKNLKYDPVDDFTPVGLIAAVPHILVVGPHVQAKNLAELLSLAKENPGKLSYGSAGIGISNHLEGELLASSAGVQLLHVPYKSGSSAAMQDVIAGRVDMMFGPVGSSLPLINAGRIKAIGVAQGKRSALVPDLPTLDESGLPGFQAMPWIGLFGPANMDPAITQKMAAALKETLMDEQVSVKLANYGTEAMYLPPAEFAGFLREDVQRWSQIADDAGIQLGD